MLSNLIANAVEHSAPGEKVDVRADSFEERIIFAVTSRGSLIPAEVIPRLFQPYFRAGENRPRSGLGLGLYIAAEIARAHGGSIGVESTAEGVTTFTVDLPHRLDWNKPGSVPPESKSAVADNIPAADSAVD